MSKVSLRVPREGVVPSSRGAEAKFGTDFLLRLWNDQTMTFTITSGSARGNAKTVGDHDIWRLPQADDTSAGRIRSTATSGPVRGRAGLMRRNLAAAEPEAEHDAGDDRGLRHCRGADPVQPPVQP
jgi:hypothetical protein